MAYQALGLGTVANDGTGDDLRTGGDKINDNFVELYTKLGDGSTLYSLTFPNATDTVVTLDETQTLTNKTIDSATNTLTLDLSEGTLTGTTAEFNTALSDDGFVTLTNTATLTNKTLTSPVLGGTTTTATGNLIVNPATQIVEVMGDGSSVVGQLQLNCHVNTHGQLIASQPHSEAATNTLTLPGGTTIGNADATLVSDTGTQTLSNKTLASPTVTGALQLQVYADTTARDAAITSPAAGMMVFLTDNGSAAPKAQVYDGSAWVDLH